MQGVCNVLSLSSVSVFLVCQMVLLRGETVFGKKKKTENKTQQEEVAVTKSI